MKGNQATPFERNRYYVGKLLTSADFQTEQAYGIRRRCFLNEMMFGHGVVCGLGVYSLDDQSVMIDSGVAINPLGQEIVVESSEVRKLSAITGFHELEDSRGILCIRYREEQVQQVYAIGNNSEDGAYHCNRIREGWELVMRDEKSVIQRKPESEFLIDGHFYEDSKYRIYFVTPATASCAYKMRIDVVVEVKEENAPDLRVKTMLQTPAFFAEDGEHQLCVDLHLVGLEMGQVYTHSYWLLAQTSPLKESLLIADVDTTTIEVGSNVQRLKNNFIMRLSVDERPYRDLVTRAIGAINLENRRMVTTGEDIPLATIILQKTKHAYLIEAVDDRVKHYVETTAVRRLHNEYEGYYAFHGEGVSSKAVDVGLEKEDVYPKSHDMMYATGTCEVPVSGMRKGRVVCSDEILHGLGMGNIMVNIGFEYLSEDDHTGNQRKTTIFGDSHLFGDKSIPIPKADTAVKVFNDRGSFTVAARLQEDARQAVLVLRWMAVKMPVGNESGKLQRIAGKSIAPERPTVVMATKESHYFNVRFKNMEPTALIYALTDANSGTITSDGIYTAPGKEGVYEIRISCSELPLISTYAYAVVKKLRADQTENV